MAVMYVIAVMMVMSVMYVINDGNGSNVCNCSNDGNVSNVCNGSNEGNGSTCKTDPWYSVCFIMGLSYVRGWSWSRYL